MQVSQTAFFITFVCSSHTFWVSPRALTRDRQTVHLDWRGWTGGGGGASNSATEFGVGADSVDTESTHEIDDADVTGGGSVSGCLLPITIYIQKFSNCSLMFSGVLEVYIFKPMVNYEKYIA